MEIVLIPAYRPDDELIRLIDGIREKSDLSVLVVDDGSGEAYRSVFQRVESKAVVLHHETNRGKGSAIKTGLAYVSSQMKDCTCVILADADGQHPVEDILAIRDVCVRENRFILTTRIFEKMPFRSRLGNTLIRIVYTWVNHRYFTDNQCGLRAIPASLIEVMSRIPGDRYEYEMSMLCYAEKTGISIVPFPLKAVYLGNNESSHYRAVRDSLLVVRKMLHHVWPSAVGLLFRLAAVLLLPVWVNQVSPALDVLLAGLCSTILVLLLYITAAFPGGAYRDAGREIRCRIITDLSVFVVTVVLQNGLGLSHRGACFFSMGLVLAGWYFAMQRLQKPA
ncbi:MAG: glycosyltransferase family 2 protein [Lachnospiraceae bacterium]|nr:glycosyltransferase family 2 protein [Lachnospiraceae bacterium]